MDIPQNTPEQFALARTFERVRNSYAKAKALGTGGSVLSEGPVEVWACPFVDAYNGLMSPNWPEADQAANLATALRLYQRTGKGMPVSLGPSSQPDIHLRQLLRGYKFRCSYHVPVMVAPLAELPGQEALPKGLRIELVDDFAPFRKVGLPWIGPLTTTFRRRKFSFVEREATAPEPRLFQFIGWLGPEMAGGVTTFFDGDTAGVFDVIVSEKFRRRGIGAALMLTALHHARERGLRHAALSASSEGAKLYRRVGFLDAGQWSDYYLGAEKIAALKL